MITVFGSVNLDLVFPLDRLPTPGETRLSPAARVEPGGKGANQALAAARDGASVALAAAVGNDPLAPAALALLREAGVDLTRVATVSTPTGVAAICTEPGGENQITVATGANAHAAHTQVEDARLAPGHTVLMQMELPAPELETLIRRNRGARLVLNLAPAAPLAPDCLRVLDVLVVNETEAAALAAQLGTVPDPAALRAAAGPAAVVRTLGSRGVDWATAAATGHGPAYPVRAVDTTAAGDCLTGVLAAALDLGASLPDAVRRATAAAALCCTRPGTQGSIPFAHETDRLLHA